MKIVLAVLLLLSGVCYGQSVLPLRADTVLIEKTGGSGELKVRNSTRDTLGILVNIGGGKTRFLKSRKLNDSTFVVGMDTILIRGSGITTVPTLQEVTDQGNNTNSALRIVDVVTPSTEYASLTQSGSQGRLFLENGIGGVTEYTKDSIIRAGNALRFPTGPGTFMLTKDSTLYATQTQLATKASSVAPGSDGQIIFNDGGTYGAISGVTIDKTQKKISSDTVASINARATGILKVGINSSTSTAKIQSNTGTPFGTTPYLALGPLLSNSIYSTLHTSDTVTVSNVATVPVRAYQINRNLIIGANGNIEIDTKPATLINDILRVRDTVTLNSTGHNNWYANSLYMNILKAGGYSGRSAIRGGLDGITDGVSGLIGNLTIGGSSGSNNFHLSGDWSSITAELAHNSSTQDTIDHYMAVFANTNYLGRILKAEYLHMLGLGGVTDSTWSIYCDESQVMGYHEGKFGIGKRVPIYKLDVNGSMAANKDSLPNLGTLSTHSIVIQDTATGRFYRTPLSNTVPSLTSTYIGVGSSGLLSGSSTYTYDGTSVKQDNSGAIHAVNSTTSLGSTSGANIEAYASAIPTAADQRLGGYRFGSRNGTGASNITAAIESYSNGAWTDNVTEQTYMKFSTTATNALVEVMRLTANNRVGFGITNPRGLIEVKAGFAAAGGSPWVWNSGPILTTAIAGGWGYDASTNRLNFSPSTTWKSIPLTNDVSPTAGQFAVGNGTDYTVADIFPLVSVSTTGTTTLAATAKMTTIKADATGGAVVITLTANHIGQIVNVKKMDSSINTVTVQGSTGNIDGAATKVISLQYAAEGFQWDGTDWIILP